MITLVIFDFGADLTGLLPTQIAAIFEKHWPKLKIGEEKMTEFW